MDGGSDTDIILRIRHGHRDAFDDLYRRYADDVFSMCLLILGESTVARAAAGTAFALVAQTRLSPLSDPTRLRSWLLELARGSALAWSGSPQARAVPVPHGVTPEEMLDGTRLVPAPASLREGLARTFDRAANVVITTNTGSAADTGSEADTDSTPRAAAAGTGPDGDTTRIEGRATLAAPSTTTVRLSDTAGTPAEPTGTPGRPDPTETSTVVPLTPTDPRAHPPVPQDWRSRPAVTVAASLVLAVAGVTAAINWPTAASDVTPHYPDIAYVAPTASASRADAVPKPSSVLRPTVAGQFTSRVSPAQTGPTAPGVPVGREVPLTMADSADPQGPSGTAGSGTITGPARPETTATPSPASSTTGAGAPTRQPGDPATTAPPASSQPPATGASDSPPTTSRPAAKALTREDDTSAAGPATVRGEFRPV